MPRKMRGPRKANVVPKRTVSGVGPEPQGHELSRRLKPGQTPAAATAEMLVAGLVTNVQTAVEFSKFPFGNAVDLTESLKALVAATERVARGELGDAEAS